MAQYVKSKSKTGKKPRTGNRYEGQYETLTAFEGERVFILKGAKIVQGKQVKDYAVFNSQAAARKAGWTIVD